MDLQAVEQLNAKAKALNSQRERLLGQREAAKSAYEKAVLLYKQKYGVELTEENLQSEYNAVKQQLQEEYEKLQALIASIESGEYKKEKTVASAGSVQTSVPQTGSVQAPSANPAPFASPSVPNTGVAAGQIPKQQVVPPNIPVPGQTPPAGVPVSGQGFPAGQPVTSPVIPGMGANVPNMGSQVPNIGVQVPNMGGNVGMPNFVPNAGFVPNTQQNPVSSPPNINPPSSQSLPDEGDEDQPFTPKGWGEPIKDNITAPFDNLFGNAFK